MGLNRENQILLNKLVDISQGKNASINGPATYKKAGGNGPRSLNIAVRKKETARIERENHAFAKRLFENGGTISVRKLDAEFMAQQEVKNRVRRAKKPLPGLTGVRANQLPPLDESAFRRTRKSTFSKSTLSATHRRANS